jgi:hypothetical protein
MIGAAAAQGGTAVPRKGSLDRQICAIEVRGMDLPANFVDRFPDRGPWREPSETPTETSWGHEVVTADGKAQHGTWVAEGGFWWGFGERLEPVAWRPVANSMMSSPPNRI